MKSFSEFTEEELVDNFGLELRKGDSLFPEELELVTPRIETTLMLGNSSYMHSRNERATCEILVVPVLMDVARRFSENVSLFSGEALTSDKEKGLTGVCDYIFSGKPKAYMLQMPIINIVEAKKQDMDKGTAQCIAELLAARQINESKGVTLPFIYGCVTTGIVWQFIKFEGNLVQIDSITYTVPAGLPSLLGAWKYVIEDMIPHLPKKG